MKDSEGSAAQASSASRQTIQLHIVSPSSEVSGKLTFADISIKATVGEIKRKIQDAIATKPGPERQRIIYRGHAIVNQDLALETLLGAEAVCPPLFSSQNVAHQT